MQKELPSKDPDNAVQQVQGLQIGPEKDFAEACITVLGTIRPSIPVVH